MIDSDAPLRVSRTDVASIPMPLMPSAIRFLLPLPLPVALPVTAGRRASPARRAITCVPLTIAPPVMRFALACIFAVFVSLRGVASALTLADSPQAVTGGLVPILLAEDSSGRLLVGSRSLLVDGDPAEVMVRLLPSGARDRSFAVAGLQGEPWAAAVATDGRVYVSGDQFLRAFLRERGAAPAVIARLDSNGGVDAAWNPQLVAVSGTPLIGLILATPQGVLIQGNFATIDGVARPGLARLDVAGNVDQAFAPAFMPTGAVFADANGNVFARSADGKVHKLAAATGGDLAGFTVIESEFDICGLDGNDLFLFGPMMRRHDAGTGALLSTLPPPQTSEFTISGGWLYEARTLAPLSDEAQVHRRSTLDGTPDPGYESPIMPGPVRMIRASTNGLLVASREWLLDASGTGVHRLDGDAQPDPSFQSLVRSAGGVARFVTDGNDIVIGGGFSQVDGIARDGLARLRGSTFALALDWMPARGTRYVRDLVAMGGSLFASGYFKRPGSSVRANLLRIDGSSGDVDADWPGPGGDGPPYPRIARRPDGNLLVAGLPGLLCGTQVSGLVSITPANPCAVDATYVGAIQGDTIDIVNVAGADLFLVGSSTPGGPSRVERRLASGAPDPAWHLANTDLPALAIAASDVGTFIGGSFSSVDGVARAGLARLTDTGELDTNWIGNVDGAVTALALANDGRLLVARRISESTIEIRSASDGRLLGDPPVEINGTVSALHVVDDQVLVGGSFDTVAGQRRVGIARLQVDVIFASSFEAP